MESNQEKPKLHHGGEEDTAENGMDCTDSCSETAQTTKDPCTNLPEGKPTVPSDVINSARSPTLDLSGEDLKRSFAKSDSNTNEHPTSDSRIQAVKASCASNDNANKGTVFNSHSKDATGASPKTNTNIEGLSIDSHSEDSKIFGTKSADVFQACGSETPKDVPCASGAIENARVLSGRFNHEVVQIKAQKAEINRRITAFMERKQAEINENNVREFCNVIQSNQENSCARTDAVFTPYPGFKSRVKVSRVVNTYGPLTRPERVPASSSKARTLLRDCGNQAVEERLQNMESHLFLQTGGPVPKDVYQRIKRLEEKILELEGLSPEYFQTPGFSGKRRTLQAEQSCSLVEIDAKIAALREKLARRAGELHSRNGDKFRG